ncbi:uncharacterized protein TrAFT101_006237 [Trichoderma asperellum]|uniref:uncharacterized protein n=1 Tax=Trichoderma asperellum TaxID=101201 RepID=UPI0033244791|nr:hypothetical protein TrAFT101_006237 [Trichoderma asperellum]
MPRVLSRMSLLQARAGCDETIESYQCYACRQAAASSRYQFRSSRKADTGLPKRDHPSNTKQPHPSTTRRDETRRGAHWRVQCRAPFRGGVAALYQQTQDKFKQKCIYFTCNPQSVCFPSRPVRGTERRQHGAVQYQDRDSTFFLQLSAGTRQNGVLAGMHAACLSFLALIAN